jgi:hypothetical protein
MLTLLRILVVLILATPALAQGPAMPDPKEIAGVPLPMSDLAVGTVTVRVIRGSLANNVTGQLVELIGDGAPRQQRTGESGRAEFAGLRPGARVKASAVVGEERLESQEFAVPAAGGVRVLLVATDPDAAVREREDRRLAEGPAQRGAVVLGEQSRFVVEIGDEALNVFCILQIVNTARVPVEPVQPLVFESAPNGGNVTLLNGSSPRAAAKERRVEVAGPFPPGTTLVQFAYAVLYSGPDVTIEQRLPVPLNRVTLMAQKAGEMRLSSPQLGAQREVAAQGDTYIVGQGPGLPAGQAIALSFSGLPHTPRWPRHLALTLASVILLAGAWSSFRTPRPAEAPPDADRAELEARRDRLFKELAAIERQRSASGAAPAQESPRRRELMTELESVYAALDH